jgi:DNA replication and repair protein RecF
MTASRIHRLSLTHFRSYRAATVETRGDVVALVGPNGAGKTNCIEAISFLSPGRGLRRATLDDVADNQGDGSWAVSAEVEGALGLATLGTGIDPPLPDATSTSRRCRIDREPVGSAVAFGDHLRMVWLTPAMDGLFMGAASERRRFFDRLVLAIDSGHSSRVSALDRSLRSRNRLLEDRTTDSHWLDAVERETAELAVAVAAMRGQTVTRLAASLRARGAASAFPSAAIMLDGWMENALVREPATAVEDRYRQILRDGRPRDAAAGRTLDGPHLTDLQVIYAPKNMPARDASTGEQKALLIGLVLAHAGLVAEMTGITPLLLLDEVVAHLDPGRRAALFQELAKLGAQIWMTGADPAAFVDVGAPGEIFDVENGRLARCALRLQRRHIPPPNRAFASLPNRPPKALKNRQKDPFIQ